jgi:tRNA-specific 2-thiouridylase
MSQHHASPNNDNNNNNGTKDNGNNNNSKTDKKPKAVALLSGGLDSNLAIRMMLEQGVDVEAVAIKTPFCDFDCGKGCGHRVKEVADELGVKLKTVYFGEEYLRMLKEPRHGYGSGMNPCIDCRQMMYGAAKEHMEKIGADFVVTGEVLFQRPMSQNNRALHIIEDETGLAGKVLRPLSAKHLPPTNAEKAGLIKRENMGDIKGRSRKGQLALAKQFGIQEPPNAAGGCLLTDPAFSKRVEDAMKYAQDIPTINDIELLKVGRHFRLTSEEKLVVGRNKDENEILQALVQDTDIVLEAKDVVGPICILRGQSHHEETILKAAAIALRYSDAPKDSKSKVKVTISNKERDVEVTAASVSETEMLRI